MDITDEIKHKLSIDKATPHDWKKPTSIIRRPMIVKAIFISRLFFKLPFL
tara:strand:- start:449 stop:598 length:150 start_codon:yes stop_codon:yes gene_type:complete